MCQVYNGNTDLSMRSYRVEKGSLFDHHRCYITMSLGCRERKMVGKRVNSVNACRTFLHSLCMLVSHIVVFGILPWVKKKIK